MRPSVSMGVLFPEQLADAKNLLMFESADLSPFKPLNGTEAVLQLHREVGLKHTESTHSLCRPQNEARSCFQVPEKKSGLHSEALRGCACSCVAKHGLSGLQKASQMCLEVRCNSSLAGPFRNTRLTPVQCAGKLEYGLGGIDGSLDLILALLLRD